MLFNERVVQAERFNSLAAADTDRAALTNLPDDIFRSLRAAFKVFHAEAAPSEVFQSFVKIHGFTSVK